MKQKDKELSHLKAVEKNFTDHLNINAEMSMKKEQTW
jgi:hypothetical protein